MERYRVFKFTAVALTLLYIGSLAPVWASDLAKEQAFAEGLKPQLVAGELTRLRTKTGLSFAAIFTPSQLGSTVGGIVVLHDINQHPDWVDVISPLRRQLPLHGWATLSLQMPITSSDAPYEPQKLVAQSSGRIQAGIEFLRSRGIEDLIVVGYGLGTAMALNYLAEQNQAQDHVKAVVAISANGGSVNNPNTPTELLKKIKLPVYDIYGSQDLDLVTGLAQQRAAVARQNGNQTYRQLEILGANHHYDGMEQLVVSRVKTWVRSTMNSVKLAEQQAADKAAAEQLARARAEAAAQQERPMIPAVPSFSNR